MNALLIKLDDSTKTTAMRHVEKWDGFCGKVEVRLAEIFEEADGGITEIMNTNPYDNEPLFAAFKTLDSRFLKIGKKIRDALEKLEGDWERSFESLDDAEQEKILDQIWDFMQKRGRALDDTLETKNDTWRIGKQGEWGRLLALLLEKGKNHSVNCTGCGSALELQSLHAISNSPCPYCHVVNTLTPPPATLNYYGWGVEFLSAESALTEYDHMLESEKKYNNKSTSKTRENYKDAIREYWNRYYGELKDLYSSHPHLVEGFETAVDRKVKHNSFGIT